MRRAIQIFNNTTETKLSIMVSYLNSLIKDSKDHAELIKFSDSYIIIGTETTEKQYKEFCKDVLQQEAVNQ